MTPGRIFFIFGLLFLCVGLFYSLTDTLEAYDRHYSGLVFLLAGALLALYSGIYILFARQKRPLPNKSGYIHALLSLISLFFLCTAAILLNKTTSEIPATGGSGAIGSASDLTIPVVFIAGSLLFLIAQVVFIMAVVKALSAGR